MHLHLPKPLHGWREFVGEVGIIVVGVLIALGAEQLVEEWSWHERVRVALKALDSQIADDYYNAAEIVVTQPCVDAQLIQIEKALAQAGSSWRPVPVYSDPYFEWVVRQPKRTWGGDVWRAMNNEGVASHVDRRLRLRISDFYASTAPLSEEQVDTYRLSQRLLALGQPLAPPVGERFQMIQDIEEMRGTYRLMRLSGNQVLGEVDALGMGKSETLDADLAAGGTVQFCRAHHLPLAPLEPIKAREID
jgi:hypothetical protein